MKAFMDWTIIVTSPALFFGAWYTDDVSWLRFCTFLWLINLVINIIGNRIEAHSLSSTEHS